MNRVCLTGRICAPLEIRYNSGGTAYTRFNLAVNRNFKNANGEYEADFISCVVWRERAEMMCKHLEKGSQIAVDGRIQTGSYETEKGEKRYTSDVIVDNVSFLDSKKESKSEASPYDYQNQDLHNTRQDYAQTDAFSEFGEAVSIDDNFLD